MRVNFLACKSGLARAEWLVSGLGLDLVVITKSPSMTLARTRPELSSAHLKQKTQKKKAMKL
jgi:type IV secretory pathway TrbD component